MNVKLQILISMISHMITFILLGLGSIYENGILTFLSLVSMMIGLFLAKEVLETLDTTENATKKPRISRKVDLYRDIHE